MIFNAQSERALFRTSLSVKKNVYLRPGHVNYWWKKFQEDDGKISDPSVYPQHALSADPKVTLQSLEVLTT
jgi:hypothetical protein